MSRRWTWLAVLLLLVGVGLYSDLTGRKRKYQRALRERNAAFGHLVDIGVELRTVVQDPKGVELLEGKPPLRIIRRRLAGGIVDTRVGTIVAASQRRTVWYCSEDQEPIILHGHEEALGQYVLGSEGAGKTTILPKWHYYRWLEHLGEGREGGQVAPTRKRLKMFLRELRSAFPRRWYSYIKSEDLVILADGTRIQLVSAHQQSKDEGSPIQGYTWSWAGGDEDQDMVDRHEDIEARGRGAKRILLPSGVEVVRYKQMRTGTPKDTSTFRSHRAKLESSGLWQRRTMLGTRSPFIGASFWEAKRKTMSKREYERRVLAMDLPPELTVFHGWDRKRNLVPIPRIAIDVTPSVIDDYQSYVRAGARFSLLCCHDPGNIFNTTLVLRLYMFGEVPTWMVVGELQTKQTTARQHARELRGYLQRAFGVERGAEYGGKFLPDPTSSKAVIFCDPHGKGESETDYDAVYGAFQAEGLDVFAPSRKRIKRSARIEMTNRLLCDADDVPRLMVACDEQQQPLAPVLVDAFESMQKRPGDDDPEGHRKKDEDDKTHAPAALGYGLWSFEQEHLTPETIRRATVAARRLRI